MKKLLLIAAAAAFTLAANAQMIDDVDTNDALPAKAPVLNEGEKPSPFYDTPVGTFFSGFAKSMYRLNSPMLYIPAFTDVTFVNGSTGHTSFVWKYVNPEGDYDMFAPQLTSTDEQIVLKYSYTEPHTIIEAPQITATNEAGDSVTNMLTNTPTYLVVGGESSLNTTTNTRFGWMHVSPRANTGTSYSTNYFGTNVTKSGENWSTRAGVTDASVRGFAELYLKPTVPYALRGFSTHIYRLTNDVTGSVKMTLFKVSTDAQGNFVAVEDTIATQTLQVSEMEDAGSSSNPKTRFYLLYDKMVDHKTGQVVEGYTIDYPIMVSFTLADDDLTSQFSPMYVSVANETTNHAYIVLNAVQDEEPVNGMFGKANYNWTGGRKTRSFCVSMLGAYEYIVTAQDGSKEYEINAPETAMGEAIQVNSSVPYADALGVETNWVIEAEDIVANNEGAPARVKANDWIDVTVTDNYDDELNYTYSSTINISLSSNKGAERQADVKITFLGGEYVIHVTQAGTSTGIEDVVVAQDDANAPVYNVMGQRVNADAKGLLIKNGKKILVK